jgi:hypothetical protein
MALSKFQQAFKDARASGKKEFEFNGKKYNTKYKEEASAPAKKADTKVKDEPSKVSAAVNQESSKAPAEAPAEASAEGKPFRQKNLTDLIGLSSNIRKSTTEPTPKEDSNKASEDKKSWWTTPNANLKRGSPPSKEDSNKASEDKKSWWTTPNANLKRGSFPSGKEIREALGSSYKKGGSVSSASKRADGIAQKGKTRGKMC